MNLRTITALALLLVTPAALAQPAPPAVDPAFLQAAIAAIQAQRNAAADGQAAAEARIVGLNDQIAKLQARLAEMEKKPSEPKDEK